MTGEILGIVVRDTKFRCLGDCDSDEPRIEVRACLAPFELRVLAPDRASVVG